jgi:hypothetical protein
MPEPRVTAALFALQDLPILMREWRRTQGQSIRGASRAAGVSFSVWKAAESGRPISTVSAVAVLSVIGKPA